MSEEECKGGDCSLRPQFDESATQRPAEGKKVRLSTSKYVQLLIDARETDPDCWPPGLERAAEMVEQARAIEEACIERWGEFDPDKLSRAQSRQYFEIQLALDALQEESDEAPLDIEGALDEARHNLDAEEASAAPRPDAPATPESGSTEPGGYALPTPPAPAGGEGFYAAPLVSDESFFLAQTFEPTASEAEDEGEAFFLGDAWIEMPPLARPDNYA